MKPPSDEDKRGHLAVAISIVEEDDAYVFFFDDLHLTNTARERRTWEHKKFVTTAAVLKEKLHAMDFSTDELAGMGLTILGSLKAMYGRKS